MTVAPSTLVSLQAKLVAQLGMVNLGINGDAKHIADGGYHIGAVSLRNNGMPNDYSLYYNADRQVTHDYSCAVDIGGSPDMLMLLGNRIVDALKNKDPRVYGKVRAVNAPFGGQTDDRRYDCENPDTPADDNLQTSEDRGHIHVEFYRNQVTNQAVVDGLFAVFAGFKIPAATSDSKPSTPAPLPVDEDEDMAELIQLTGTDVKNHDAVYVHSNRVVVRWVQSAAERDDLLQEYKQKEVTKTSHSRGYFGVLVGPDPEPPS